MLNSWVICQITNLVVSRPIEHGIPDDKLKTPILDRIYEMKKRKNRSTSEVMSAIESVRNSVFRVLVNEAIFAYFVPLEMLFKMGPLIIEAAVVNSNAK